MQSNLKPLLYGGLIIAALITVEIVAILNFNGGRFTYTLDDPYIHLALADNIATGHYGLNGSEFSAPSSSILWPFLLAVTAPFPLRHLHPLILNLMFAAATFWLLWRLLTQIIQLENRQDSLFFTTLLLVIVPLATNFVGLILNGMEHSAQVFFVVLILWGIVIYLTDSKWVWWLPAALILSPLIRYENLPLSAAVILFLLTEKQFKSAGIALIGIGVTLAGFSLFLLNLDLWLLPTSVIAKTVGGGESSLWQIPIDGFYSIFTNFRATLLFAGLILCALRAAFSQDSIQAKKLAIIVMLTIVAHLLFGRYGWYHRYEIYIWTLTLLSTLFLYKGSISRFLNRPTNMKWGLILSLLGLFLLTGSYLFGLSTIPTAANNIFEQHYQIHRLAVDFYKKPIAANDIGYVAFQNDQYVLDLWGLASTEALTQRQTAQTADWMDELARAHSADLVIIYEEAFPTGIPENWVKLGQLHLSRDHIIVFDGAADFFATDQTAAVTIRNTLNDFSATLPPNVTFIAADIRTDD